MTRSASTVACLLALGACQSESELRFVSTLDAQTNGVQFSQDGNQSHVGMSGMTCTVSTEWGCPTDDADLPTEREVVLDHLDGQTLAASDSAVHVIDGSGWIREADIPVPQVIAAPPCTSTRCKTSPRIMRDVSALIGTIVAISVAQSDAGA